MPQIALIVHATGPLKFDQWPRPSDATGLYKQWRTRPNSSMNAAIQSADLKCSLTQVQKLEVKVIAQKNYRVYKNNSPHGTQKPLAFLGLLRIVHCTIFNTVSAD